MPGGDRTGPMGAGPMTGRGAGFCAGYAAPGYANPVGRCGFGRMGRGGGRGWRHQFYATGLPGWGRTGVDFGTPAAAPAIDALRQQAEFLQNSLTQINKRIEAIENK